MLLKHQSASASQAIPASQTAGGATLPQPAGLSKPESSFSRQADSNGKIWISFAIVLLLIIIAAIVRWILRHPFGFSWDEALYFNEALDDIQKLHSGSLRKFASILIGGDVSRPPAYRLIVLPFLASLGFHTALARCVSLMLSSLGALFIFLTVRRLAGRAAGFLAVLVYFLSPEIILGSSFYSTQAPLYLATSAMLYFVLLCLEGHASERRNWIGLGLAIGLGFLSKTSFATIAPPVLAVALVVALFANGGKTLLIALSKAGTLALFVAAPWWLKNLRPALHYAAYARGYTRNSLGSPSLTTFTKWLYTVFLGLVGPGSSILVVMLLLVFLWKVFRTKERLFSTVQQMALICCACAGLPLVIVQLSGTNHLLGHISPVVIPLAIVVGLLSASVGWSHSRTWMVISGILLTFQVAIIASPTVFPNTRPVDYGLANGSLPWRTLATIEQWDWKTLQTISYRCDIKTPAIAYLGNGTVFNPPSIAYPWLVSGAPSPDITWLWRYEQGPINWNAVMKSIGSADIVVTAPNYVGMVADKQDLDNQHNTEFAEKLAIDPRFQQPIVLEMGRFEPVNVLVFVRRAFACR